MKKYYFLSGLPRSGSTLLGSILNQNENIFVSPTSPLMDIFYFSETIFTKLEINHTYDKKTKLKNVHKNLTNSFYEDVPQNIVIDKHRAWPKNVKQIRELITNDPKIICTYRPLPEVICSYLKLIHNDPNNIVDKQLSERGVELNTYNRSMWVWFNYVEDTYNSFKYGLENNRESILVVEYDDLVNNTTAQINRIYDFMGVEKHEHFYTNIQNTCAEAKDLEWGFNGLHNIRNVIEKTSYDPKEILSKNLYQYFHDLDNQLLLIG